MVILIGYINCEQSLLTYSQRHLWPRRLIALPMVLIDRGYPKHIDKLRVISNNIKDKSTQNNRLQWLLLLQATYNILVMFGWSRTLIAFLLMEQIMHHLVILLSSMILKTKNKTCGIISHAHCKYLQALDSIDAQHAATMWADIFYRYLIICNIVHHQLILFWLAESSYQTHCIADDNDYKSSYSSNL